MTAGAAQLQGKIAVALVAVALGPSEKGSGGCRWWKESFNNSPCVEVVEEGRLQSEPPASEEEGSHQRS